MAWQLAAAPAAETNVLHKNLESVFGKTTVIEIQRVTSGRVLNLGTYTIEKDDTPRGVVDLLAQTCKEDADTCGGEQRYEFRAVILTKRPGKGSEEEIKSLGRLRFGEFDPGLANPSGSVIKETAQLVKSLGDANEKAAEAEGRRMDAMNKGVELMANMMGVMAEATEKGQAINANAVRMFELKIADDKEQRAETAEREARAEERAAEQWHSERTFGLLNRIGDALRPFVPGIMQGVILNMHVNAATKAKSEGFDVSGFPGAGPPPPPSTPAETVRQVHETRDELVQLISSLSKADTTKVKKAVGEDVYALLVAASEAVDDHECFAILVKLRDVIEEMGEKAIAMFGQVSIVLGDERTLTLNKILAKIPRKKQPS